MEPGTFPAVRTRLRRVLGHFAQSDEEDKTMARDQIARFQRCLADLREAGVEPRRAHHCNSGGVLDLRRPISSRSGWGSWRMGSIRRRSAGD